jgi:hypothetical protein
MNFKAFSQHWVGSWIINGLSVVAFIIVLKVLVARLPSSGVIGAGKAAVGTV